MLVKNQQGGLDFTKGLGFLSKIETGPATVKEKAETAEISFASDNRTGSANPKKGLQIALLVVVLGLIATAGWYFLGRNNSKENNNVTVAPANTDTLPTAPAKKDTLASTPVPPPTAGDGYTFKVVFMITTDSGAAVLRMNTLINRKHTVIMYKQDSIRYRLAEPFSLPLTDTARIKDSLNKYYYSGRGFIEL